MEDYVQRPINPKYIIIKIPRQATCQTWDTTFLLSSTIKVDPPLPSKSEPWAECKWCKTEQLDSLNLATYPKCLVLLYIYLASGPVDLYTACNDGQEFELYPYTQASVTF
jgi:hypothetical protein